jgi:Ca2+-binding RTX toxin-like protein
MVMPIGGRTPTNGDDVIFVPNANETIDGRGGEDTVNYRNLANGVNVDLAAGTSTGKVTGGGGNHTLVSIEHVVGSSHGDVIRGNGGANELAGGAGGDTVFGLGGDDVLFAGQPGRLFGGDTANNRLEGGGGNDMLVGGDGNDTLIGGNGDDRLLGNGGKDTIDGGDGVDTASFTFADQNVTVVLPGNGVAAGDGSDSLSSIENVEGSASDDLIVGSDDNNMLAGDRGNDEIDGDRGADYLIGDAGDDLLNGGGNDGAVDVFFFAPDDGHDRVFGFIDGIDKIEVGGGLSFEDLSFDSTVLEEHGESAVIEIDGGRDSITIAGVPLSGIDENDFIFG